MVVAGGASYSLWGEAAADGANEAVEGVRVAVDLLLVNLRTTGVFTADDVTAPPGIKTKGAPAGVVAAAFVALVAAITAS